MSNFGSESIGPPHGSFLARTVPASTSDSLKASPSNSTHWRTSRRMIRLRLIVVVLVAWLGVAAGNPVVHAASFTYDGPHAADVRVDARAVGDVATVQALGYREWPASTSIGVEGASTTSLCSVIATEAAGSVPDRDCQ